VSLPVRLALLSVKSALPLALNILNTWRAASRPVLIASIFAAFASLSWQETHLSVPPFANCAQRPVKPAQTLAKSTVRITPAARPAPTPAALVPLPATVAAKP